MVTASGALAQLRGIAGRGVTWQSAPAAGTGRPAAVLVLFGVLDHLPAQHASAAVPADLDVLLVSRAATLTHHAGQVSFPGGRIDPDDDGPVDAALREAVEETGLDRAGVEVLGTLGEIPLPVSDHRVSPVLAWWSRRSVVGVVDAAESAEVFRAPVADLLDPAHRVSVARSDWPRRHRTPGFQLGDRLVWGFTGLVLDRLFDELGWTEAWDRTRVVEPPG